MRKYRVVPVLCHMADDEGQRHQKEGTGEQIEEHVQQVKKVIKHGSGMGLVGYFELNSGEHENAHRHV